MEGKMGRRKIWVMGNERRTGFAEIDEVGGGDGDAVQVNLGREVTDAGVECCNRVRHGANRVMLGTSPRPFENVPPRPAFAASARETRYPSSLPQS